MLVHFRKNRRVACYDPNTLAPTDRMPPDERPCGPFKSCGGCPYPSHGFVCYSAEGDCLKTDMEKIYAKRRKETSDYSKLYIEVDTLREVYFNPDSNAGGQLVTNHYSPSAILETLERYGDLADFWSCLEGEARQYLTDIDTPDFASAARDFVEALCDFSGTDEAVMTGLRDWAQGVEQWQSQTMQMQ